MNLNKLVFLSAGIALALSATTNLDTLQTWVWRAQAKLIYESRTETWGSPRFFPRNSGDPKTKTKEQKAKSNQF